jgi:biopolymer transport protein ExbB
MNKLFAFIAIIGLLQFCPAGIVTAQDTMNRKTDTNLQDTLANLDNTEDLIEAGYTDSQEEIPVYQKVKAKFIEGGVGFMGSILLCFIFGLAIAIERIIYLNLSTTNTAKLLDKIEESLDQGGTEAAKEICRNTRGPVASIFYQGLDRSEEGLDMVEKSIISYGSVQMGLLEKNLSWISLFIALSPMLGFMGTVQGMIMAFDNIRMAGNVSPQIVAEGIGVALLTTLFGLIVAVILQVFYNYLLSKIDSIVNRMEDASISLMDILIKYNIKRK